MRSTWVVNASQLLVSKAIHHRPKILNQNACHPCDRHAVCYSRLQATVKVQLVAEVAGIATRDLCVSSGSRELRFCSTMTAPERSEPFWRNAQAVTVTIILAFG